jgi:hypothetical protein
VALPPPLLLVVSPAPLVEPPPPEFSLLLLLLHPAIRANVATPATTPVHVPRTLLSSWRCPALDGCSPRNGPTRRLVGVVRVTPTAWASLAHLSQAAVSCITSVSNTEPSAKTAKVSLPIRNQPLLVERATEFDSAHGSPESKVSAKPSRTDRRIRFGLRINQRARPANIGRTVGGMGNGSASRLAKLHNA